jgi:hypothetical protein
VGKTITKYHKGQFKVKAVNAYNDTGDITATGDTIFVGNCSNPPVIDSTTHAHWNSVRVVGGERYVSISVQTEGKTTYDVTMPASMTFLRVEEDKRVYFSLDKAGNYKGSDVKLTVSNTCGSDTTDFGDGIMQIVSSVGYAGPDECPYKYAPSKNNPNQCRRTHSKKNNHLTIRWLCRGETIRTSDHTPPPKLFFISVRERRF